MSTAETIDQENYNRQMVAYYDHSLNGATNATSEGVHNLDERYATEGDALHELAVAIQETVRGRRVLEIACGHGRWTRFIADAADYVLATDLSPKLLEAAQYNVHAGKDLPEGRVKFLLMDAHDVANAPGDFDAAVLVNFFQHIPLARHDAFLDDLHTKLSPGAVVFLATNHVRDTSTFFQKPGAADWFEPRTRPDGSQWEIIDNVFTEADLRRIFEPRANHLQFTRGKGFYWITYEVAG